ncbi:MAG: hypothetical protein LBQ43_02550 [Holosporales bacterium]|jgi:hypothetical protein|nr:hypothetical protein [Holosporales bacterium]
MTRHISGRPKIVGKNSKCFTYSKKRNNLGIEHIHIFIRAISCAFIVTSLPGLYPQVNAGGGRAPVLRPTGIGVNGSPSMDFKAELKWQSIQRPFIEQYVKQKLSQTTETLLILIKEAQNKDDLFRIGILSCLWENKCITQIEVDTLWMKSGALFFDNITAYLAGKLVGAQILKLYKKIDANDSEVYNTKINDQTRSFGTTKGKQSIVARPSNIATGQRTISKQLNNHSAFQYTTDVILKKIKMLCGVLYCSLADDPQNQYLRRIITMVTSARAISCVKSLLDDKKSVYVAESFKIAVSSEFALKWLDAYVTSEKGRNIVEQKLMTLSAETLILAGQRALNGDNAYPKALAAYTLAATKGASKESGLNELVNFLINNRQTQAFEPFLVK